MKVFYQYNLRMLPRPRRMASHATPSLEHQLHRNCAYSAHPIGENCDSSYTDSSRLLFLHAMFLILLQSFFLAIHIS